MDLSEEKRSGLRYVLIPGKSLLLCRVSIAQSLAIFAITQQAITIFHLLNTNMLLCGSFVLYYLSLREAGFRTFTRILQRYGVSTGQVLPVLVCVHAPRVVRTPGGTRAAAKVMVKVNLQAGQRKMVWVNARDLDSDGEVIAAPSAAVGNCMLW